MERPVALPEHFLRELAELEAAYVRTSDPIEQSGFHGGPARWRAEREPILDAIREDGELLDIGCANGYLLECLGAWGRERGVTLTPYGLDQGTRLIELARRRFPGLDGHFYVGNAWDWEPPRTYRYVYQLLDVIPDEYLPAHLPRLLERVVSPGGRLIIGDYGSHSRRSPARDVAAIVRSVGLTVAGTSEANSVHTTRFAWVERAE
jgi:SAM-dependent methyltransferase